jgi:glycosyltransferase involved in cell wall biosynthesis
VEHDRAEVRRELGVADDEILIGHVGRYVAQKNHDLLLPVFAEVCRREPRARLLLVGDGPLAAEIDATIDRLAIRDRVIQAGIRTDVPRLMRGMDLFLFPSRYEGLGLALLEAQVSGLPCVFSDVVPPEADLLQPLVHRLPLDAPPAHWAGVVLEAHRRTPAGLHREEAGRVLERSPFNVRVSVRELEEVYGGVGEQNRRRATQK